MEIQQLKQQIARHEARLPELDGEKKIAVSSKNFKEAARVSAEMKEITAQLEAASAGLAAAEAALGPANEGLSAAQAVLEEKHTALVMADTQGGEVLSLIHI